MRYQRFGLLFCVLAGASAFGVQNRPHIIVMLADDLGYNDVGMHGSAQIPTPNIDALAYNGQNIRHYTQHICTPSRMAFLTGNYPIRNGMQGSPLRPGERRDISPQVEFMATKLKKLNYATNLIGKWHTGHYNKQMVPTGRGFDYHFGYYNGLCGYFDYMVADSDKYGFDLHKNNIPHWKGQGSYATELFTREAEKVIKKHNDRRPLFLFLSHLAAHTGANGTALEVPDIAEAHRRFSYIKEPQRQLYAEIVRQLDLSTGRIMKALANKDMLKNSIVLWMSDNGGQTIDPFYGYANFASNWPLRGMKFTLYQGGVRNAAALWSPFLKNKQYVNKIPIHIVDWLSTFYSAAGGNPNDLGKMDGKNQWPALTGKEPGALNREPILLNIDEVLGFEGILSPDGQYKLINGTFPRGDYDDYYGDSGRGPNDPAYDIDAVLNSDTNQAIKSLKTEKPLTAEVILRMRQELVITEGPGPRVKTSNCTNLCLYDLINDPTEKTDVKADHPDIVKYLYDSLKKYRSEIVPQKNKLPNPAANPAKCNGVWFTWTEKYNFECLPLFQKPGLFVPSVQVNLKTVA